MPLILEVIRNTLAKLRPEQAADLRSGELQPLTAGLRVELQSYAYGDESGLFNSHIKFAIANPEDWIANLNTWYVYEAHARVLLDGKQVYPQLARDQPDSQFTLRISQNTYWKQAPVPAVELPANQRHAVNQGTTFELLSYAYGTTARDFNGHIKFTLKDQTIQGFNTWYVYEGHAEILAKGIVVYPQIEHEKPQILRIIRDTVLKRQPLQSQELPVEARYPGKAGQEYALDSYAYANDQGDFNNHIKFTLAREQDYLRGYNTWFVYEADAQVLYDGEQVYPQREPPEPTGVGDRGIGIKLPGYASTFFLNEPIIPGGQFTWAEATKNGSRIPATRAIVNNILVLAKRLERPRAQISRPFIVTSWYRDPMANRAAGGASYSRHLYGQAIDFYVNNLSSRAVANALSWWPGGLGSYAGWVHLDTGPTRRWYR